MPTYDYLGEANGRVLGVFHPVSEVVDSWGELGSGTAPACEREQCRCSGRGCDVQ